MAPDESTVEGGYDVTIPPAVREELGLEPGDRLAWSVDEDRVVAEVVSERYPVGDLAPVDAGETDTVVVTRRHEWS